MALYGPLVSSCSALDSCWRVVVVGCAKDAFHAMMGNACWLYSGVEAKRPSCSDLMCAIVLLKFCSGVSNWWRWAVGPMSIPR